MNKSQKLRGKVFLLVCYIVVTAFFPGSLYAQDNALALIVGAANGLHGISPTGSSDLLWSGGEVKKIIRNNGQSPGTSPGQNPGWVILTSEGILVSDNLRTWERRNNGLPTRTIKVYENNRTSFITTVQEIKDLKVHPSNPAIMVCVFKEAVYLTRDGGRNWRSLGMPNYRSNGLKSAAVATIGGELAVFVSHNIYGFYYYLPDRNNAGWVELNTGIETLETTNNPDEIADISVWVAPNGEMEIFVSQTFRRRLYRLDWDRKRFDMIWRGAAGFGTIESLSQAGISLRFIQDQEIMEFTVPAKGRTLDQAPRRRSDIMQTVSAIHRNQGIEPICIAYLDQVNQRSEFVSLNELWLLFDDADLSSNAMQLTAGDKEGLYLPVNHAIDNASLAPYMETIRNRNLNMIVIDMKDDYGRLRFTPQSPALRGWGRVFMPVNLDVFLKQMKDAGVYTVARIVVFKDPEMAVRDNGKYAVWDSRNNKPWRGYVNAQDLYDEQWVDPYSEEYWEYIALLSEELCNRGFDEIQYDYIRFPTDGINLGDASYRWRSPGMDMESAIISFLRHVRGRIKAPISVDIYGANGWYRTGARTGQEVEMLLHWVDIICPMYYPSHFEQDFLAQSPAEQRPYRIYYDGTLRTRTIARNKIIVRPWAQAFYLNVSYDRQYYDLLDARGNVAYVSRQLEGVRAAGNGGLTYWNNSGRYDDIPRP